MVTSSANEAAGSRVDTCEEGFAENKNLSGQPTQTGTADGTGGTGSREASLTAARVVVPVPRLHDQRVRPLEKQEI